MFRYRDVDVHSHFSMDDGAGNIPMNWRFYPPMREQILEEDENKISLINGDGVTVRQNKQKDSVPQYLAWPVSDRNSWEKIKEERYNLKDIQARFPDQWQINCSSYQARDYPLGLRMEGFFATPRELMGVQNQLMMYYDDPGLMHDINNHLENLWLAMAEEIVSKVELDFIHTWEDMAFKNGPLVSPKLFREFISPHYKKLTDFFKSHAVDFIFVDTDGNCFKLIEPFMEAGVTGMFPFEVQSGMDIVEVRRQFPKLLIQGGLDKTKIARGKAAIDVELETKLPPLLLQGGYIPFMDHLVPPDVSWENFVYYRERVNWFIDHYSP
jgi:uroporphyrinogen decarboxylase